MPQLPWDEHPYYGGAHHSGSDPTQNDHAASSGELAYHRTIRGEQNDHAHERHGDDAIDHSAPE